MYKCTAGLLYSLTRWWRQVEVGWAGFLQVSRGGVGWSVGLVSRSKLGENLPRWGSDTVDTVPWRVVEIKLSL